MRFGLERMQSVCAALGHPERGLGFVHVAGTNGKGSVCALVESGLRSAGYRTGLYTSPHLHSPTERIRVDGNPISEEAFADAFDCVHRAAQSLPEHPTYFETLTAMALVVFRNASVDQIVWETGLGGRLDATNIVSPELTIITPISFDHMEYLGSSLAEIAAEKAGILKQGVPAIFCDQHPEALAVLERHARERDAAVSYTADVELDFPPPLAGRHQVDNTKAAVLALQHFGLAMSAIRAGLATTVWPGRLERVRSEPEIYLDGAHNVAGAAALADFIRENAEGRKVWMIFGVMKDKQVDEIGKRLFPLVHELIVTAPHMERALAPDAIPARRARIAEDIDAALRMLESAGPDDLIFITGSLYLVAEARERLLR